MAGRSVWVRGAGLALAVAMFLDGAALAAAASKDTKKAAIRSLLPRAKGQRVSPVRAIAGRGRHAPAGVGTIQYDNDVPFSRDGNGVVVGNRFNVGVQDPHTVATVSFRRGGAGGTSAAAALFNIPITTILGYGVVTGLPATTTGGTVFVLPLQITVTGQSGPFLGGLVNGYTGGCAGNTVLGAPCDGPALTAGTVDPGMGFHAVRLYTAGTSGVDIPNRNAIFRVTGNNLPVELMGFGVE